MNITGNITYGVGWDPNLPSTIPYFTLIVKGNINIGSNVTRLDGLYIVQPVINTSTGTVSKGVFNTCRFVGANPAQVTDFATISSSCRVNKLIVNGAVIAQQVKLLRSSGTLSSAPANENAITSTNVAEVFNFTPSLLISNPAFAKLNGGALITNTQQSLFNLPPVF